MTRGTTSRQLLIVSSLAAVGLIGLAAVRIAQYRPQAVHQTKAVYYCPMHPTYTSDRPGDCPICNMRLAKREGNVNTQQIQKTSNDICYLHNCPMAHEGKPCPMLVVAKAGEQVTCPICGRHVVEAATIPKTKKILYWTDPMIPGYRSDKPGKSPMGMDLVPVYAEPEVSGSVSEAVSPEGYTPILVTPQKRQLIGVTTAPVQTRPLTKTIRTAGRIAYDPELYQAQQEYLQSLRALKQAQTGTLPEVTEQAQRLADASRMRLRLLGLGQELLDEIATWQGPDQSLLLADPAGRVWLYASVYEFELPLVNVGQLMTVEVPSIPGKIFEGVIRSIDPVLNPTTRSARVRAILTDPNGALRPEMFVNASIRIALGEVLTIPETAVFDTGTKRIVFVDKGKGLFEPRDVTLGVKADGYDEVKSGAAEGETVVTSGNFLIDSESRLKGAVQSPGVEEHQHGQ